MLDSRWGFLAILFFNFQLLCKNDTINIKYNCKQIVNIYNLVVFYSVILYRRHMFQCNKCG